MRDRHETVSSLKSIAKLQLSLLARLRMERQRKAFSFMVLVESGHPAKDDCDGQFRVISLAVLKDAVFMRLSSRAMFFAGKDSLIDSLPRDLKLFSGNVLTGVPMHPCLLVLDSI